VLRSRPVTLLLAGAVGALLVAGLAVHGVGGGLILAVVAVLLVLLSSATWAHLHPRGRVVRVVVIAFVSGIAVAKLVGAI
jgi:uncharacterized protein DUF6703